MNPVTFRNARGISQNLWRSCLVDTVARTQGTHTRAGPVLRPAQHQNGAAASEMHKEPYPVSFRQNPASNPG